MLYFLDTNIIIDLLEGKENIVSNLKNLYQSQTVKISDIVYYEVLRGFKYKNDDLKLSIFEDFCNCIGVEYQTKESMEKASEIYADLKHKGKLIEDDDILIGSLALVKNGILITNNKRHLSRINDLKIEVWNS
ncbi:MAG: PIN domain-containing protein [Treponema sp.]